jgi:hypothetical protein
LDTPQGTEPEAVRSEALDLDEVLNPDLRASAGQMNNEVDGLSDEGNLRGDTGLLGQLIESENRFRGTVGVDGRKPAGMPCIPGLQEDVGLRAAHLTDDDAAGKEAENSAQEKGD